MVFQLKYEVVSGSSVTSDATTNPAWIVRALRVKMLLLTLVVDVPFVAYFKTRNINPATSDQLDTSTVLSDTSIPERLVLVVGSAAVDTRNTSEFFIERRFA